MKLILIIFLALISVNKDIKFDFGAYKFGSDWNVIDDGVMGGLSKGKMEFTENTVKFYGKVSTEKMADSPLSKVH